MKPIIKAHCGFHVPLPWCPLQRQSLTWSPSHHSDSYFQQEQVQHQAVDCKKWSMALFIKKNNESGHHTQSGDTTLKAVLSAPAQEEAVRKGAFKCSLWGSKVAWLLWMTISQSLSKMQMYKITKFLQCGKIHWHIAKSTQLQVYLLKHCLK